MQYGQSMKKFLQTAVVLLIPSLIALTLVPGCVRQEPPEIPPSGGGSGAVEKLTLEELTARADFIVLGTVTNLTSQWTADHKSIYTLVALSVEELIKGDLGNGEIVIMVPGGTAEGVTQTMEDAASFRVSERVVVFLRQGDDATYYVIGGFQGKYTIEDDKIAGSSTSLVEFISWIKTCAEMQPGEEQAE